ncbi:MAG: sugar phosphate nucleotidyltransferase [Candidatus Omnitrophica bacterium]|nr:sugar phosphate nucleotidyltransferase [Candidatus Omnitrophota bacterium]MCM8798238.1 sugar phosphate nucleotidyltransferase [Candidatus Omnitrophota bacterium]
MKTSFCYLLILAGGRGVRLWPRSKKISPKHTLFLNSGKSLLQKTYERFKNFLPPENILVVTLKEQEKLIKKQLSDLPEENFIIEPLGKNTLPAILAGTICIGRRNPEATVCVLPSDHLIKPREKFLNKLQQAIEFVEKCNGIVLLGIKPDYPATGYGYIKIRNPKSESRNHKIYKVEKFIEKPDLERARRIFDKDNYFWNAGIFIFKADKILEETERIVPEVYKEFISLREKEGKREFKFFLKQVYKRIPSLSIDKAIMERLNSLYMLKGDFSWLDIGSWESLARIFKKDKANNVNLGKNFLHKTRNCIIINEQNQHLIATLSLENIVIVHTPKVTLVYPRQETQTLKSLMARLEKNKKFKKYL